MSLAKCPEGYVELPVDKTRCRHPSGYAITVPKICPAGFTVDSFGLCVVNAVATVEPSCPSGYTSIPTDPSNCTTSTSSTIVKKVCPDGYTLQTNGLCSVGNTYVPTGPTFCSPRYAGKNCTYQAQVVSGYDPSTGTESAPNTICAFREGDAQFPCDPGCCEAPSEATTNGGAAADGGATADGGSAEGGETTAKFPIWAIILLIVLGIIILALLIAWAAKKISRKNR